MPIVVSPDERAPLTQGDLLDGTSLYVTEFSTEKPAGFAAKAPSSLCLVLSRPCVTEHKSLIVVAAVEQYKQEKPPGDVQSFKQVLDFLTSMRDGAESPDVFYLGQIPNKTGRYRAKLDSLHSISVPQDPAQKTDFVRRCRIASLTPQFSRALHTRLFTAFASMGFDDHNWASDEDLAWLVHTSQAELLKLESEIMKCRADDSSASARGATTSPKNLQDAEKRHQELLRTAQPYIDEHECRAGSRATHPA